MPKHNSEELSGLAIDMHTAQGRGKALRLTDAETAFYDPLELNDRAVAVLGAPPLPLTAVRGLLRANCVRDRA